MPLPSGTHLGSYQILALLGAGGMGEVYKARDTKLGRDVALKTLPDSVSGDSERLARFRREAHLLAALNHPHIASIYGLEETNSQRFLVLELVAGETLAARIQRGPLPVGEALAIAQQIAEALEAAHEKGIIHRDLKPANIALTPDDQVKVLDFGLAKAADAAAAPDGITPLNSPTITSPVMATGLGVFLGTAAYMSPEQARGRAADKRSDVWAFGCVLFEMLTGKRAFEGDEVSDTLATILKSEPAWSALPPLLPPAIGSLLQGCLEKNHRERISDISAARFVLKRLSSTPTNARTPVRPTKSPIKWVLLGVASGAAFAATAVGFWPRPTTPRSLPVTRFAVAVPDGRLLTLSRRAVAVSPDGTRIAYVADGRLYLRSLADAEARPITGADPGIHPAFSPDGESLVFWTDPALKRISVTGGMPITLCETAPAPYGIDWSESGIVFVQPGAGILRVSANGGAPEVLVPVGPDGGLAQGPQLLPDGETLLFTLAPLAPSSYSFWERAHIVTQSIKTGARKTLIDAGSDGRYLPTGHLTYMVEGTLMAVPFDVRRMQVTGGAVPVVEGVRRSGAAVGFAAQFAFSTSGVLVYVPGPTRAGHDDVFVYDRQGNATALKLPRGSYSYPRVSPDGKSLALETYDGKQTAVSVYDLSGTSTVRRLTFGGNNRLPIWSADGKRIAFQSDREGDHAIFWQPVGGGTADRLTRPERGTWHMPESWSPRDDVFLFGVRNEKETSLWTFSLADRKASRFDDVTSIGVPTNATFSPDGRWIAYQSGVGGGGEATTYVQPFPANGTKFELVRGGRPMWARDGKELFFVPAPSQFMAVSVRTDPTFGFGAPVSIPRRFGLAPPANPRPYDILPDGRIVAVDAANAGEQNSQQIQVVLNWFEELQMKLPGSK
jgi:serine/threonine protein kinase